MATRLAYTKKALTDRFSQWRRGNYDWVEADRQAEINAIVHPKPGGWDPWDLTDPAADGTLDTIRENRRRYRNANVNQADIEAVMAEDPDQITRTELATALLHERFRPVGFKQVRRLGMGGSGVAWLFSMEDRQRRIHNVVVKVDVRRGGQATREELNVMKRLSGSRHITQRLLLQAMPDPSFDPDAPLPARDLRGAAVDLARRMVDLAISPRAGISRIRNRGRRGPGGDNNPRAGRIRRARRNLDDAENVLVMEYLPNGDLGSWLERLARDNEARALDQRIQPPEKILWSIFNCLWRGCLAMAFPGKQARQTGLDPRRDQIPMKTEVAPRGGRRNRRPRDPLVHFDLDPSNVFVGEFDGQNSHDLFPILKTSDFGLSQFPKSKASRMIPTEEEPYLWGLRERGKPHSLLPEQTSEAWDYVADLDGLQTSAIAGNYGSPSNVFHIGLIMWQIITGFDPEIPFVPRPYAVEIFDRSVSGWTYGHALLDQYEDWSLEDGSVWPSEHLRNTIAQCMDYIPSRRPTLNRLEDIVERQLARDWDQTDDEMRQWSQQIFSDAPSRSMPAS